MRRTVKKALLATGLAVGLAGPAGAQSVAVAVAAAPTSVDPHFHTLSPNNALAANMFEAWIEMDDKTRPVAALALSWKLIDDTTWEFKLRPGVKFHNGEAFTAEDVAYSIARPAKVPNSPASFAIYTKASQEVQVVDATTVRIRTDRKSTRLNSSHPRLSRMPSSA